MAEDREANVTRTAVGDEYATVPQEPNVESLQLAQSHAAGWPIRRGRYELLRLLGEGAMGSVYLARDTQLGRQVAMKVPKFAGSAETAILRFQREARVMATLRHANLCPVYDVGEIDGVHYLTMAYIPGQTLAGHLTAGKPLPAREVTLLILKLAQAVGEAHRCGIVHRDLKPANVIIDQRREPVVMDFGLAGLPDGKSSLTNPGSMIGTPAYMSPEQVRGDLRAIGPASDVYSLGAIMYQMLTGSPPFAGSIASIVRQALAETPECPSSLEDGVDPQLGAICLRALAKDPAERFASGDDFAVVLRDYLKGPKPKPVAALSAAKTPALPPAHVRQAEETRQCWQRGDYEAALPILESLAASTEAGAAAYASWARRELPKVRDKLELLAAHQDFLQAANLPLPPLVTRPRSNRNEQDVPTWLIWVMATPACVLLFLTVIVLAGWENASPLATWSEPIASPAAPMDASQFQASDSADLIGNVPPLIPEGATSAVAGESTVAPTPLANNASVDRAVGPPVSVASNTESADPPRPAAPSYEQLLSRHDINDDRLLELNEISSPHREHLGHADVNDDGILSREEVDEFHARPPRP